MRAWVRSPWARSLRGVTAVAVCSAGLSPAAARAAGDEEYVAGCAWYVHGEVYDPPRPAQRVGAVSGRGGSPEEAKADVVAGAAGMQHYADQPCKLYGPLSHEEADALAEELRAMGAGDDWPDDPPPSDLRLGS